jgi:hypothetical protein
MSFETCLAGIFPGYRIRKGTRNEDSVVFKPQLIDRIEEFAHIGIRLCKNVSKTSVSGRTFKVGMGVNRFVGLRIGEIGEERLLRFSFAPDEIDRVVGDFPVDRLALLAVVHRQSLRRFTSL